MVFLHATNGDDLTAVVTTIGHARLSIPLYNNSSHSLQSTLTYSFQEDEATVTRLLFVGRSHLVAVLPKKCLVWNVVRGVLVHTITQDSVVDVASNELFLYILTLSSNAKWYIYEYSVDSGKLIRKIKAGRSHGEEHGIDASLAVSNDNVAVLYGNAIKVMRLSDGIKVSKCKLDSREKGIQGMMVMNGTVAATTTDTGVSFFQAETGTEVAALILEEPPLTPIQLALADDGHHYQVVINNTFYILDVAKKTIIATCKLTAPTEQLVLYPAGADKLRAILVDRKSGLHFRTVTCVNEHDGTLLSHVEIKLDDDDDDEGKQMVASSKKRKQATVTLGSGQAGGESGMVVDEQLDKKKQKYEADPDLDEPTIAERLKQLAEEFDRVEDDDVVLPAEGLDFEPKRATTESLAKLLHQALSSGDDPMLELALGVRDKSVITTSLKGLDPDEVGLLLTKLTMRLSSKPTRAADLVPWIGNVLATGKIRQANLLRPLRNLLQERVESFPHLLQLEGRLSMLASM